MSDVEELAKRLENESPWFCDLPKAAKLIRTLQAERDRLAKTASDNFAAAVDAQSRAASLAEALEPFAEACARVDRGGADNVVVIGAQITIGDLRRARSLLSQSKPNE